MCNIKCYFYAKIRQFSWPIYHTLMLCILLCLFLSQPVVEMRSLFADKRLFFFLRISIHDVHIAFTSFLATSIRTKYPSLFYWIGRKKIYQFFGDTLFHLSVLRLSECKDTKKIINRKIFAKKVQKFRTFHFYLSS